MEINTIAIIGGTGRKGSGLALRLAKKDRTIIIGSRSEEKAVSVATTMNEKLGEEYQIIGTSNFHAANLANLLILCVPLQAQTNGTHRARDNPRGSPPFLERILRPET